MKDYKTEFNSITLSLLEILDSVGEIDSKFFRDVPSKEQVKKEIEELAVEFAKTDQMSNIPSMLRMKIHIARKMAEKLMLFPDLVREYMGTTDLAVICAIGRKVKIVPDIADLEVLESIVPNATTNVSKGFLTNALAELIYAGQLRIGDDERLYELLRIIKQEDGDRALLSNVERVEAALDYLTGRSRAWTSKKKPRCRRQVAP